MNALPNLKDAMNLMPGKKKKVVSKEKVKALTTTKKEIKQHSAKDVRNKLYGSKE